MLIDNACKVAAVEQAERAAARRGATARGELLALQGNNSRRSTTLAAATDNLELLDLSRAFDPDRASANANGKSAYVRITRGCNKFCTYCVVPYTRGAEVHRPPDHIVDECKRLADQGVIEITLLGQTVNHYIYTHGMAVSGGGHELPQVGPGAAAFAKRPAANRAQSSPLSPQFSARTTTFADLLKRIHDEVPAVQRLRFVTSYPRDFGDDILHVMAASPRICRYLHVPAQSGSDRILKLMNRGYTVGEYLDFIARARAILPDVSIAGDIIVGFPTETDDDFQMTCHLLRQVRFKNNFIFKYSPRPGTVAIDRFPDDVPEAVKRRRNAALLGLQSQISAEVHAEQIGRVVELFVEKVSGEVAGPKSAKPVGSRDGIAGQRIELGWQREPAAQRCVQVSGRTEGDLISVFDVADLETAMSLIGRIVSVCVTGSGPLLLRGELASTLQSPNSGRLGDSSLRRPAAASVPVG
jgi:tRNA-2-methylthio-N6-dimethylallyladenosine synthase